MPLAAARAGLVHVPINPLLKRAQVAHILADSGAQFWNADTDHRISETAFVDAIHLRWSAAQALSVDIAARLAPASQMAVVQRQ